MRKGLFSKSDQGNCRKKKSYEIYTLYKVVSQNFKIKQRI